MVRVVAASVRKVGMVMTVLRLNAMTAVTAMEVAWVNRVYVRLDSQDCIVNTTHVLVTARVTWDRAAVSTVKHVSARMDSTEWIASSLAVLSLSHLWLLVH